MILAPVDPRFDLDLIGWALESFAERSGGKYTVQSYVDDIKAGTAQAWLAIDEAEIKAVAITEMSSDDMKTVTLTGCTGEDAKAWVFLVEGIKDHARKAGSKNFQAIARPGWERHLKEYGFKKTHVLLEVAL